ncbi:MAG: hypothetical protein MI723_10985 [Caulobacterales bacterium]|nr:hypothetical protein [Caulobacterales bacterium]
MLRSWLAVIAGAASLWAAPAFAEGAGPTGGWREAVIVVRDVEPWIDTLETIGGWELRHRGPVAAETLAFWGAPEGASAEAVVMANRGTDRGFLRLVAIAGVEQRQIRANDHIWDTGGIFNVNVRAVDAHATANALIDRGWTGLSAPVNFTFGPYEVVEWIARGPDGARFAVIEREAPPLEGWPHLIKLSRAFNSTQIVRSMDEALLFYRDQLGFEVYLEHRGPGAEAGPNVLGLPHELYAQTELDIVIVHPQGTNDGSIELLQFHGLTGADFSDHATPLNRGLTALRFPVADARAYAGELANVWAWPETEVARAVWEPYGTVEMFAIRAPDGARLEFFEVVEPASGVDGAQ